jgi:hypothetical protein
MAEPTKGPWTATKSGRGDGEWTITLHTWGGGSWGNDQYQSIATVRACGEVEANARLIATTPDLLAALEDLVEVSTYPSWAAGDCRLCEYDFHNSAHASDCPYARAEATARAALAKAREG